MASIRFTIASNANQSIKTPLIVPQSAKRGPKASDSVRALVLKTAQSKLRIKKGTRIFLSKNGKELLSEDDWSNLPVDTILLVSSGEDYVGAHSTQDSKTHPDANPECPVINLGSITTVDSTSLTQLSTTAHTLPGIVHAVGQPDLHPGTKFPIGAVFASRGWIHPPLIGSDIGCGMTWYKTTLSRRNLHGDKAKRISDRLRGLEGAWKSSRERQLWLSSSSSPSSAGDLSAGDSFDASIGTIGAGNHFAEIQIVEQVDPDTRIIPQDSVVLLVHSGSRGFGGDILRRHTANEQTSLPIPSDAATSYLADHDKACSWAKLNRDLIALRFLALLEPHDPSWALQGQELDLDSSHDDISDSHLADAITSTKAALAERTFANVSHNCISYMDHWPPLHPSSPSPAGNQSQTQSLSQPDKDGVYIHRKGAAPSTSDLDNVILPLPGSRGTPTILLRPTFSTANNWGLLNGFSVAHGAGRAMSRAKAAVWVARKYKGSVDALCRGDEGPHNNSNNGGNFNGMGSLNEEHHRGDGAASSQGDVGDAQRLARSKGDDGSSHQGGTWVVCDDKALVWEEAPESYKDVWSVAADLERTGAAKVVGWAKARISYKVRKE